MKSIMSKITLLVFTVFIVNTVIFAGDEIKNNILITLKTSEQALQRSFEFTGFDKSKTYIAKRAEDIAILTKVIDSTTPSIRDTINSKSVWLVKFTGIQLQPFKDVEPNDLYPKDFEVILDPETGNLLKINSSFFEFEPNRQYDSPPELKIEDPGGLQSFFGFPEKLPTSTFYDVVKVWNSKSTVGVKHISATYIMQSHPVHGDKGYWCVTFRGVVGPNKRIVIVEKVIDPESGRTVATKGGMAGSVFDH